ncbi:MAG: GNAT family N-acetyltransferase [Hyphomicrobiales bacterium]
MSIVSIGIRRGGTRDAAGIAAVHDEAWRQAYRGLIPGRELERMVHRRGPQWWSSAISNGLPILILEFDGVVAGYTTFGRSRLDSLPHKGEIYELYLSPCHQGLGLGRRLFEAARGGLARRGLTPNLVWALEANDGACAFYQRMGGLVVARGSERFGGSILPKIAWGYGEAK